MTTIELCRLLQTDVTALHYKYALTRSDVESFLSEVISVAGGPKPPPTWYPEYTFARAPNGTPVLLVAKDEDPGSSLKYSVVRRGPSALVSDWVSDVSRVEKCVDQMPPIPGLSRRRRIVL